jgi:predicted acylesterase/phospholipase RssA
MSAASPHARGCKGMPAGASANSRSRCYTLSSAESGTNQQERQEKGRAKADTRHQHRHHNRPPQTKVATASHQAWPNQRAQTNQARCVSSRAANQHCNQRRPITNRAYQYQAASQHATAKPTARPGRPLGRTMLACNMHLRPCCV